MIQAVLELVKQLLLEPTIIIGMMVGVGYTLNKKGPIKVITGTISAMVGLMLIIFGGSMFTDTFKPIVTAVSDHYGITGYLMDPYAMRASTQEALGQNFGFVGYVFLLAFSVNILLVFLGKYTKAKGIFLTGNTGFAHAQAILWLVSYWFGFNWIPTIIISGVFLGIYWAVSTTVPIKAINKVTNDGGFTIAHNQMFGIWFFSKIAKYFGDPEKDDAENLKLPGWLGIFNHNVTAIAIIMTVFTGGFLLTIGTSNVQELAGNQHWMIFIMNLGLKFSMYMVILLQGVRMMVGEINQSFKGIQEKLIPNAVPGVDVAALLPFSANAATLGFIFTTLGTVFSIMLLVIFKSPIMVLPDFVPLFFSGGPIGVIANRYGGYKSVIVCTFLLGIIQTFGTIWAIRLSGLPDGIGWTGLFDWATVIPAITEAFKWIVQLFNMGPFS